MYYSDNRDNSPASPESVGAVAWQKWELFNFMCKWVLMSH